MSAVTTQSQSRRGRARAAACERPARGGPSADTAPTLFASPAAASTLDALVSDTWQALAAGERASCPLCGGELVAGYGAHARPAVGRCGDCGTTLS